MTASKVAASVLCMMVGLAAVVLALNLFRKTGADRRDEPRSRRRLWLICVIVGSCLMAAACGLQTFSTLFAGPAARARLRTALHEPLTGLTVVVEGSDPFQDRSDACVLRLLASGKAGSRLISEIPASRLLPLANTGAGRSVTLGGSRVAYVVPWQTVIAGATTAEGGALATRLARLDDLERFDRLGAEIVGRAEGSAAFPGSLRIASRGEPSLELFEGLRAYRAVEPRGDRSVWGYEAEEQYITFQDRLTGWNAEAVFLRTQPSWRGLRLGLLAPGVFLLAVGIGLLGHDGRRELVRPAMPPRPPSWAAPVFVAGVWGLMLVASLTYIARYGYNAPYWDDWDLVPYVTGHLPLTPAYLWEQQVEHRYPLTKAIVLSLIKLSGDDFRAATYFRSIALGTMALALILVAHRLRGWTSAADAFFPLLLLQGGFPIPRQCAWLYLAYLLPTVVATPVLLITAVRGTQLTIPTAILAGLFMALLPLCSAAGLLYLPPLLVWMGCSAVIAWRSPAPHGKRTSLVIVGGIVTALFVTLLYFRGYDRGVSNAYAPSERDIGAIVKTILAVISSGLGPAAEGSWPLSGLAMLVLVLSTTGILVLAAWRDRQGPTRAALGLLAFLGAALLLAAGLGWGRAGFGFNMAFAYSPLSVLIPCLIYLAWELDRSPMRGHLVQALLFFCLGLAVCINLPNWLERGRHDDAVQMACERDMRAGVPSYLLIARHRLALGLEVHKMETGRDAMLSLKRAGVGSFGFLQSDPPLRAVAIPLTVTEFGNVEWDRPMSRALSKRSFLTFKLPEPMYAAAIRVQCGQPSTKGPFSFGASWKESNELFIPPAVSRHSCFPVEPLMIAVGSTIDEIRIYPNMLSAPGAHPFQFPITKLEVLVPADQTSTGISRSSGHSRVHPG